MVPARLRPGSTEKGSAQSRLWTDFSYVASSGYREKVILALCEKPKLPKQLSAETGLRLAHVSRALRELRDHRLVECLTPETRARGRLYTTTDSGSALAAYFLDSSHRYTPPQRDAVTMGFIPKMRASFARRVIAHLIATRGKAAVLQALRPWSVDAEKVTEDSWLSIAALDEFLELIEAAYGDGSYRFIRSVCLYAVPSMSSVREQLLRAIPLRALAERAPIVYNKEWNYGRLEVQTGPHYASFLHYDWLPTPAMCAMFHGVYEGILRGRRAEGTVTETRCVRQGDDHCEYLVRW